MAENPGFFAVNKTHIIQTLSILIPTLGAVVLLYINLRVDITQAQSDIRSIQTAILEARSDDKVFIKETTGSLVAIRDLVTQLRIDVAHDKKR